MNKRTESIRLKHLQDIYYEKLQGIAYDVYDEQLHNLVIRPEELDADIHRYFRHTQPSLQDFYSHYASQWEYFHEMNEASDTKFLHFLKNSAYTFSMKYHLVDLNVKYYLQRFDARFIIQKKCKVLIFLRITLILSPMKIFLTIIKIFPFHMRMVLSH